MEQYIGENTKTKYLQVINKINLFHIIYLNVVNMLVTIITILLFGYGIKNNIKFIEYMSYILIAIFIFLYILLLVFIIAKIIIIVKNNMLIKYYKSVPLTKIKRVMINYDYKLWLTAVKDTFHPMSFNINADNKSITYKTGIYFTNSERYNKIFKFIMPKVLIARSYIDVYALIGYDELYDEMIIIDIEKQ